MFIKNIKLLYIFILCFYFNTYNHIDINQIKKELKNKIFQNNKPEWLINRVKKELEFFYKKKIQKKDLDKLFNSPYEKDWLIRIIIKNNNLKTFTNNKNHPHIKEISNYLGFIDGLKIILETTSLPDLDFIVCTRDAYSDFYPKGPLFCYSKEKDCKFGILIPPSRTMASYNDLIKDINAGKASYPWGKKINKVFWRGGTTSPELSYNDFLNSVRYKASLLSLKYPDLIDIKFNWYLPGFDSNNLNNLKILVNGVSIKDHFLYKYQLAMDGITCAWTRTFWQMHSECLLFKAESNNIEWYYNALEPYKNYIPVNKDCSDLPEKVMWAINNDDIARKIAYNAADFAKNNLTYSDFLYYIYVLLNEYAKLQNFKIN